jgi:NAD-dependent deacetylase
MTSSIAPDLISQLRRATRVVALTGAGISAESGVPTFRDAQSGLWAQYDPQELATAAAFRRNPSLVWDWYEWRRSLIAQAAPNAGHEALVAMEQKVPHFTLVTQNVDGLHRQAGSRNVLELHGNIVRNKCFSEETVVAAGDEVPGDDAGPPLCPHCGDRLRPDVVWFGEALPENELKEAIRAVEECQVLLCIGTSGLVHPAASLPLLAAERGALTVEINPQVTALSQWMDYVLRGPAGEILPALLEATWPDEE